jgi:hypothetical protein
LQVNTWYGGVVCPLIQPPAAEFCKIQFFINAQFKLALVVVCYPALATTPLSICDEEVFITILRLPIWPHNNTIAVVRNQRWQGNVPSRSAGSKYAKQGQV